MSEQQVAEQLRREYGCVIVVPQQDFTSTLIQLMMIMMVMAMMMMIFNFIAGAPGRVGGGAG